MGLAAGAKKPPRPTLANAFVLCFLGGLLFSGLGFRASDPVEIVRLDAGFNVNLASGAKFLQRGWEVRSIVQRKSSSWAETACRLKS